MGSGTDRFGRSDRLLDSRDFRRVLRRGNRRAQRDVVTFITDEQVFPRKFKELADIGPSRSRLGITASRKLGGAVVRNRFKRRVRAWFRMRRGAFSKQVDLVVIAKPSAAALSFDQLDRQLCAVMELSSVDVRDQ